MLFTQLMNNMLVELGPIEWDKFKKALLGMYFPR